MFTVTAEPPVIADYTCTSCMSWLLIFPALATELSAKIENMSVRFLGMARYCIFPLNVCQAFLLSCSDFSGGRRSGAVSISGSQRSQGFTVLCKRKQKKKSDFEGETSIFQALFHRTQRC